MRVELVKLHVNYAKRENQSLLESYPANIFPMLYYSYIITSQFYLIIRSITNAINAFNKLDAAVELNTIVEPAAELVDTITVTKCYIGSTTFFYITSHR